MAKATNKELLQGLSDLLENRLRNIRDFEPAITDSGCHFLIYGLDCTLNFEDGASGERVFTMHVNSPKEFVDYIKQRLMERYDSSRELDSSKYLTRQKTSYTPVAGGTDVDTLCRLKRVPASGNGPEIQDLAGQIWGYLVSRTIAGIKDM